MVERADHTSALCRAKGDHAWSFKSRPSFFVGAEGVYYFEPDGRPRAPRSGSPVQRGRDLQPNKDVVLMSADLSNFELSGMASVAETGSS